MRLPYWLKYSHWRYMIRYQFWGFFQRGWRGYSDADLWSLDHTLARHIAPMLRGLAENTHGYPPGIEEGRPDLFDVEGEVIHQLAEDAWRKWLIEKAEWFEWYERDELNLSPGMSDEQKIAAIELYERQLKTFKEVVIPDFGKFYDALWD